MLHTHHIKADPTGRGLLEWHTHFGDSVLVALSLGEA
jgi:hypothetical protein